MGNNIAMGFQGIQLPNPLDTYAKVMGIQHAQNQNQLAQYQLSSAQRNDDYQNQVNQLGRSPGGINDQNAGQLMSMGPAGAAALKAYHESRKTGQEAEASAFKLANERYDAYLSGVTSLVNDPQLSKDKVMGEVQNRVAAGLLPASFLQHASGLPDNPVALRGELVKDVTARLKPDQILTAFAPKPVEVSTNDRKFVQDRNPNSPTFGKQLGDAVDMGMSPYQKGELGLGAQRNAISAQRLAQETATGTLSPETTDFLAETYRQTGNLPPMGNGKASTEARNKVLTRAAELAMGGGKDAASAAGDVRTAKADTAGATSTVKDFSSGMSARRVTANNTAINHLATMEKLATDLSNGDIRIVNAAGNAFAKATGATAPTSFDAAKQLVASEVIKAVVNNGGGVTERQEAEEQFSRANSPEQLKGVINTYKELLAGQLDSLGKQYEVGSGRKDFDKRLTPETRKVFEKVRGVATPAPAATKSGATVSNWNE